MSQVERMCPQCGAGSPLHAQFCTACGADIHAGLPVRQNNLPLQVTQAALPILAGLAGFAVRTGWRLLQQRLATASQPSAPPAPRSEQPPQARRVIRIRSRWAVRNQRGEWRQGEEEHTIEIDD
jgi:hypothetical protein